MKNNLLLAGIILALVVSVYAVVRPSVNTTNVVGSNPGPDSSSPYISNNGIVSYFYKANIRSATSTLCSFQTPNATTTLVKASMQFTSHPKGLAQYGIGKSPTMNATTTALVTKMDVASLGRGTLVATSTSLTDGLIAPLSFINYNLGTSSAVTVNATWTPAGTCELVLSGM